MARNKLVIQTAIGKLNENINAQDGEIAYAENISVSEYPVIANRPCRYAKAFPSSDGTDFKISLLGTDGHSLFWIAETFLDAKRHFALWFYGAGSASYDTDATLAPNDYAVMGKTILFVGTNHLLFNTATGDATICSPSEDEGGIPHMDYVCSVNNRMWGCARDGQIYASALGDATAWTTYEGLSTDSWALDMSISLNEPFTGCAVLNSRPVFFTETKCVTVYGDYPSTFSTYTDEIYGVMDGCHYSISEVNGYLYYLSRWGFARYNTGGATIISEDLDISAIRLGDFENEIIPCFAGSDGRVYHACLHVSGYEGVDKALIWANYVYDTYTGLWAREDTAGFKYYCRQGRDMYALGISDGRLYYLRGDMPEGTLMMDQFQLVPCSNSTIEFAPIYEDAKKVTSRKWLKFLRLRMSVAFATAVRVQIFYDGSQSPDTDFTYTAKKSGWQLIEVPCANANCDSYKIKISVDGAFALRAMSREYEVMR